MKGPWEQTTLRDEIAIAAMAAILKADEAAMYDPDQRRRLSKWSYLMADAMLKVRESSFTE